MQVRPVRSRRPLKPIPQEQLDKLWLEVVAGLGAGGIESRRIDDDDEPGAVMYGMCDNGTVTIDEPAHIVETLIHELVHRMRPTWTERKVRQAEQRLYGRLTREDIDTLYGIYVGVRKPRRSSKIV